MALRKLIYINSIIFPNRKKFYSMENLYPDIQRKHGRKDLPGNFMEERASVSKFCEDYGFTSFFNHFPQGLDTLPGEDGINISGGQQQLIALARALYRSPSLLLLDEPTSAMDTKTERFVIDLLQRENSRSAILMVTHRIHLAHISHRIYLLENGTSHRLSSGY